MSETREVRDRYTAAFSAHDMDALLATFSPAGVAVSPEGVCEGHGELASFVWQFWEAFPDIRLVVETATEQDDLAVDELVMVGTHDGPYMTPGGHVIPPSGRPLRLRCCSFAAVENRLIVSLRLYFDQVELLAQIGVSLEPPA
jgi:steroid delta-isomerase-like uncharacterized protein